MRIVTKSAIQTKKIAAKIAKQIIQSRPHKKHARAVALVGELGVGKTTFTQGFAKALGIQHRMVSPTFLIFRNYPLGKGGFGEFFHVDVYRIHDAKELASLGFKKILGNPENIVLIEWADKIRRILPKDTIWIELRHGRKETERTIAYRR